MLATLYRFARHRLWLCSLLSFCNYRGLSTLCLSQSHDTILLLSVDVMVSKLSKRVSLANYVPVLSLAEYRSNLAQK